MKTYTLRMVGIKLKPFNYAVVISRDRPLHSSSSHKVPSHARRLVYDVAWGIEEIWGVSLVHTDKACRILRFEN